MAKTRALRQPLVSADGGRSLEVWVMPFACWWLKQPSLAKMAVWRMTIKRQFLPNGEGVRGTHPFSRSSFFNA